MLEARERYKRKEHELLANNMTLDMIPKSTDRSAVLKAKQERILDINDDIERRLRKRKNRAAEARKGDGMLSGLSREEQEPGTLGGGTSQGSPDRKAKPVSASKNEGPQQRRLLNKPEERSYIPDKGED